MRGISCQVEMHTKAEPQWAGSHSASYLEMQIPVEVIFHNFAEELKLKAMLNLSNICGTTTTFMCVLYSGSAQLLGKGIDGNRSGSVCAAVEMGRREMFKEKPGCENNLLTSGKIS